MSTSSFLNRQKDGDKSIELQDLRQHNRILQEENSSLKKFLEELVVVNNNLTESIEDFNNTHAQPYNQHEIGQLAHQVVELQQALEHQRNKQAAQNASEEILQVIEEIMKSFKDIQDRYQQEIDQVKNALKAQQQEWQNMARGIEEKFISFQRQYEHVHNELRKAQKIIQEGDKGNSQTHRRQEMKISTTIEDLKQTLDKQIEEKDRTIRAYQSLLESVREKLAEKINF